MKDVEVFEWLREKIVQTRQIRPDVVQWESSLADDLVPDSFDLIELVCAIEKQFGFRVEYDDIVDMDSLQDVVHFIQQRQAANPRLPR